MAFLYPNILWALWALLIPILVHLFNFRRHKLVYFSNTSLLKTIQQESARTKKLKEIVLLMLRCLFIIALVLAFAFPYRPDDTAKINTEEGVVGVYIDNSMSMKALSDKTTVLEDAREYARDLVNGFPPSTRYLLMTNSFEVQNEFPMSQQEMLDQLDRMRLEGPPVKMNEVVDRFMMLRKAHGFDKSTLVVYSDFQENMFDMSGVTPDTSLLVVAVPMRASNRSNLSVDTVWLASPVMQAGMANELHAKITNHGDRQVKGLPVNLSMDGKVVASTTTDVDGGSTAEVTIQIVPERTGTIPCAVMLMDYPVTFDDCYRFVVGVRSEINVAELNNTREMTPVSLVFAEDPQFDFVSMASDGCDFNALSKANLIVVNQSSELSATVRQALFENASEGAGVVVFHDDGPAIDTNTVAVSDLAVQNEFFSDIIVDLPQHADLPVVNRHVRLNLSSHAVTLLHLANGDPLLSMETVGKGHVYDFATILDEQWSNLADNPIIVPLMLKMALIGGGVGRLSYTIGEDKSVVFNDLPLSGLDELALSNEDGTLKIAPAYELRNNRVTVFFQNEIPEAGFYDLSIADSVSQTMAWNDSRMESDMHFASDEEIESLIKEAGVEVLAVAEAQKSTLWRWLVLLALMAVLGEISVLRFWKN